MTGKEAAQKAQAGWNVFSAKYAGFFLVAGAIGVIIGKGFEQLPDWGTVISGLVAAWGAIKTAAKDTGAHVTKEVPSAVVAELSRGQGFLQAQVDRGKEEHEICMTHHSETKAELGRIRSDLNEVAEAVKPGWKFGMGS